MDYAQYVKNMTAVIKEMEESQKYDLYYTISPPTEFIEEMENHILEEFDMNKFHVWDTLRQFYRVTQGKLWFTIDRTYNTNSGIPSLIQNAPDVVLM